MGLGDFTVVNRAEKKLHWILCWGNWCRLKTTHIDKKSLYFKKNNINLKSVCTIKTAWEQWTLYGFVTISEIRLFSFIVFLRLVSSIVVGHRAWQVTVGKLLHTGPFGELNVMPMIPQFKKNCKWADFLLLFFVKEHSRVAWCNKSTLLFHPTFCCEPLLHYSFIFLAL